MTVPKTQCLYCARSFDPKGSLQWAVKSGQRFRRHRMKTYLYIDSNGNIKDYDGDYVVLSRSDIVTLDWEVEHDG